MYKIFFSLLCFTVAFTSCKKDRDPFEISKHHVGLLTDSTQVKDLKLVFPNDSIVRFIGGDEFLGNINNIEVFEKGGKKLLTLLPKHALDSTSTISGIRIMDPRFTTEKKLSTVSVFKDIDSQYKISRISNLINSIVVSVDDINASFTIDKNELPPNLRFDMNLKFESTHVPDQAKIKYFFINWLN
ncbi:hypothetical protein [Algibacter sp. L4_22]|uniref:hypothetical protein n=1 Tax=Algibacter sp. L4_22 TaxID=2942477 RepID=UPI00201B668B|nr:hypothetical protein [Algibacter sp. L4_22]MCL5130187.1 hypothetical protein [Algibacter sp. L4_22]